MNLLQGLSESSAGGSVVNHVQVGIRVCCLFLSYHIGDDVI